jgi:hypothetical protein
MRARFLGLLCAGVMACGGAVSSPLLEPEDASAPVLDATAPLDAAPQADAVAPDGGGPIEAGHADALPPVEAGPPPDPGVLCGQTDCDPSTDLCCRTVTSYYPQTTYGFACEPLSDLVQCGTGLGIYCDDDHDCDGGTVCCGDLGYNGYTKVSCKASCTGTVYGYQQIHFCDPQAPDCDTNQQCVASTVLKGYSVCQ